MPRIRHWKDKLEQTQEQWENKLEDTNKKNQIKI